MGAININDAEFDSFVVKQKKSAVVFFWADWDGGSKAFMPIFNQSADENPYGLSFYKLDVDGNSQATTKCGIKSVPTFIVFNGGQASRQITGAVTRQRFNEFIGKS